MNEKEDNTDNIDNYHFIDNNCDYFVFHIRVGQAMACFLHRVLCRRSGCEFDGNTVSCK